MAGAGTPGPDGGDQIFFLGPVTIERLAVEPPRKFDHGGRHFAGMEERMEKGKLKTVENGGAWTDRERPVMSLGELEALEAGTNRGCRALEALGELIASSKMDGFAGGGEFAGRMRGGLEELILLAKGEIEGTVAETMRNAAERAVGGE